MSNKHLHFIGPGVVTGVGLLLWSNQTKKFKQNVLSVFFTIGKKVDIIQG